MLLSYLQVRELRPQSFKLSQVTSREVLGSEFESRNLHHYKSTSGGLYSLQSTVGYTDRLQPLSEPACVSCNRRSPEMGAGSYVLIP